MKAYIAASVLALLVLSVPVASAGSGVNWCSVAREVGGRVV
jgi:hypothetical protein